MRNQDDSAAGAELVAVVKGQDDSNRESLLHRVLCFADDAALRDP